MAARRSDANRGFTTYPSAPVVSASRMKSASSGEGISVFFWGGPPRSVFFWGGPPRPPQEPPIRASEYLFSLPLSRDCCWVPGGSGSEGPLGSNTGFFGRDLPFRVRSREHSPWRTPLATRGSVLKRHSPRKGRLWQESTFSGTRLPKGLLRSGLSPAAP